MNIEMKLSESRRFGEIEGVSLLYPTHHIVHHTAPSTPQTIITHNRVHLNEDGYWTQNR